MAGRDLIFRVISVPVIATVLAIVGWVGVKLFDGVLAGYSGPPASLGWTDGMVVYEFFAFAIVALFLVLFLWLWLSPIREDQRQDIQAGRRF